MDHEIKSLLETLLTAQVLTLAKAIEAEKRAKGSSSTEHYVPEAITLIRDKQTSILDRLARSR